MSEVDNLTNSALIDNKRLRQEIEQLQKQLDNAVAALRRAGLNPNGHVLTSSEKKDPLFRRRISSLLKRQV